MLRLAYISALALAAAATLAGPAEADRRAVQSACFAAHALQAIVNERQPIKGDRDFDRPPRPDAELAPFAPVPAPLRGSIRRVELPKGEKLIALTFDLCEQRGEVAGYDGDVFDYLRREGVRATLFAGGKWMRSHTARTEQLISDPLFEIANHSENHRNLRLLDAPNMQAEIYEPQRTFEHTRRQLAATQCAAPLADAVADIQPRVQLFRFPFGACNPATMNAVNDAGLLAIQWDVSAGDPDPHMTAEKIASGILRRVKPGSIIVAHGNGRGWNTSAALPLFVPKLKAMGYTFVTVSELLARGKPVIAESCYDSHPGDTERYDFLGGFSLTSGSKPQARRSKPIASPGPADAASSPAPDGAGADRTLAPTHNRPF